MGKVEADRDKALAELSQTREEATKVAAELAQARGESKKAIEELARAHEEKEGLKNQIHELKQSAAQTSPLGSKPLWSKCHANILSSTFPCCQSATKWWMGRLYLLKTNCLPPSPLLQKLVVYLFL